MNFANAQGVENIYKKNDDKIKPRNFIKKKKKRKKYCTQVYSEGMGLSQQSHVSPCTQFVYFLYMREGGINLTFIDWACF